MTSSLAEKPQLTILAGTATLLTIPGGPQVGIAAVTKRVLDFVGAVLALCLLLPVMLIIALAIVLESGWPPVFTQKRVGCRGKVFTVYKFRSMVKDAERRKDDISHRNEITDGPIFKLKADPRVTRLGRFLRRSSLDELPQLFNVLLGNMSLVGPRPPLEAEVMEYEPWHLTRLSVKPGLTGLWQVSGRSDLGFIEMVTLDITYVTEWSLAQDIILLARTPAALISARGAY